MDSIPQLQETEYYDDVTTEILKSRRPGNHKGLFESNMSIKSEEMHSAAPALPPKPTTKFTLANSYNSPGDIQKQVTTLN